LGMGVIYMYLEDYYYSLECLLKAVAVNPDFPEAQYSLAELFLKTKKYKEGLVHIRIAVQKDPLEVDYFLLKSELHYALEQVSQSICILEKGLITVEEKAPLYYRLAGLLITDDSTQKAVDYLKLAIITDKSLIFEFLRIFPEANAFLPFKGLLNLNDQKESYEL
jgi:tetratricopeptide (TPR) repeat protein